MVKRWIAVGVALLACLVVVGCGVPQGDYDVVVADTEAAKAQAASLQSQLGKVESDVAKAESDLSAARSELGRVQGDIEAAQDEAAAEESRASSAQGQVSSLKSQISSLESEIKAAEATIAELEGAIAAAEEAKLTESLKELRVGYPELFHELLKLPELEEIDARDDEAIEDIAELALDAEYEEAFESMLGEGIKDRRRYCTPLQALLWVAYERELRRYDPLRGYTLNKLINDAWKNTTESKSYASERWQDFDEVVDRLNSPELVAIYLQDNFTYSYEYGEPEGVKSAEQIFTEKTGACYDHAVLAGYCLKMNGYDEVYGLKVRYERLSGYFGGHIVLVFQNAADSLYYTVDNIGDPDSAVHGPFESVRNAAEFSVREQGLKSYALGNIDLERAEYEVPCNYWPVEYSAVTEPVLEEGEEEEEIKYDDGVARDYLSAYPPIITGYLVDFTPAMTPFTIKKVLMCGGLYGTGWEDKSFEVEIWDKDRNVLYSATYPVSRFSSERATWVEVEIPDIEVTEKFYVHVYTGTGRLEGIHIGADDSVINEHSWTTVREGDTDKQLDTWPYSASLWFGDKDKVNWMIRVVGAFTEEEEEGSELSFEAATYTNEEYGFSVKYPSSWEEITPQHETTVFQAARPPSDAPGVSINVADTVEGVSAIDVYIAGLEEIGGTDIEVISESETILAGGTPASIVILQYTGGGYLTDGFVVVVEKDGKYIVVSVYTANQYAPFTKAQMSEIAHTLRFE